MLAYEQKRKYRDNGWEVIDVTSKSKSRFSPFYPHGMIPIPAMEGKTSASVEGLKLFPDKDIDLSKFKITNIKRTGSHVIGHKYGDEIIDYITARKKIYILSYFYILENTSKPLSHASIIRDYLQSYSDKLII